MAWILSLRNTNKQESQAQKLHIEALENIKKVNDGFQRPIDSSTKLWDRFIALHHERLEALTPGKHGRPDKTKVVENCDLAYKPDGRERATETGLVAWKMSSSVTHGNMVFHHASVAKGLGPLGPEQESSGVMAAAQSSFLAMAFMPAVENLEYCLDLFKRLSIRPPSGGRIKGTVADTCL